MTNNNVITIIIILLCFAKLHYFTFHTTYYTLLGKVKQNEMCRKSSNKPPGDLFISSPFAGGGGGLVNFPKTIVSIFLKEPKNKVEKFKYKKLEVMQPRIKNKSELPSVISPYEVLQSGD